MEFGSPFVFVVPNELNELNVCNGSKADIRFRFG